MPAQHYIKHDSVCKRCPGGAGGDDDAIIAQEDHNGSVGLKDDGLDLG